MKSTANQSQKAWDEMQKAAQGEWFLLQIMLKNFSREEIIIEIQYTDHDINHSTRETLLPLSEISMNTCLISAQSSYLDS